MTFNKISALFASSALVMVISPATAEQHGNDTMDKVQVASDQAQITLSGTVTSTAGEEFQLKYGGGIVTVELDRFYWLDDPAQILIPGENVTVTGTVDDDWFEGREIVAETLQLNDSHVFYYLGSALPVHVETAGADQDLLDGTYVRTTGTVTNLDGDRFEVNYENGSMPVDVSSLGYNPFDDEGLQKLEEGDRVSVYGTVDDDFFKSKGILASSIYELSTGESS